MGRMHFGFNTGPTIGAGDTITAADLETVGASKVNQWTGSPNVNINIVTSSPASDTGLVSGDYDGFGTVDQAADRDLDSLTADGSTYEAWVLNSTGRGNISKGSGVSNFGMRFVIDIDNAEPTWESDKSMRWTPIMADTSGTSTDHKLDVTYLASFIPKVLVF